MVKVFLDFCKDHHLKAFLQCHLPRVIPCSWVIQGMIQSKSLPSRICHLTKTWELGCRLGTKARRGKTVESMPALAPL